MKAGLAVAVVTLAWAATPASAHRLDEFLQATTITVEKRQVTLQMCLIPGVAVFPVLQADLVPNGEGGVAGEEQQAYAGKVQGDLVLSVDGQRLPLRQVASEFPAVAEMEAGTGDIRLTFQADVPEGGPDRRLIFENHHQSALSVYLVNCLWPRDPDIRIGAQTRNYEQSFYHVDYSVAGGRLRPALTPLVSKGRGWLVVVAMIVATPLAFIRRRTRRGDEESKQIKQS